MLPKSTPQRTSSRERMLMTARIIASAMLMGCAMFWTIGFVMGGKESVPSGISDSMLFGIWAALAVSGFVGALFFRNRAIAISEATSSIATEDLKPLTLVQTNLVIAWALLEAPALFGGVALFAFGAEKVVFAAIAVYIVGFVMTFPRAEWFGIR